MIGTNIPYRKEYDENGTLNFPKGGIRTLFANRSARKPDRTRIMSNKKGISLVTGARVIVGENGKSKLTSFKYVKRRQFANIIKWVETKDNVILKVYREGRAVYHNDLK